MKLYSGFTLVEVMISAVLVAMMGALIMSSINSSARSKASAEMLSQRFQEANQAMSRMSLEISMAYLSKNIHIADPSYVTQFKGKKNSLFFSAFGNMVHQRNAKQSEEQVLGFYLAPDKSGEQALMRRFHPDLNTDVERGGRSQILCPKVTKLEFLYYDDRLDKWEDNWIADPTIQVSASNLNPASPNAHAEAGNSPKSWRLPKYVKISMTAVLEENREINLVSIAELPMQEPLDLN